MKRWSELIDRLRRHAEVTRDLQERTRLHLRTAAVFLEGFGNQAEAIRGYEAVLDCYDRDVLYRRAPKPPVVLSQITMRARR